MQLYAVRAIGSIVSGNTSQTQAAVDAGCLVALRDLLMGGGDLRMRKDAMWAISNVMAGTQGQIQAVVDSGLVPIIVSSASPGSDFGIRKEAIWSISNATDSSSADQLRILVSCGCVPQFVAVLSDAECDSDAKLRSVALEGEREFMMQWGVCFVHVLALGLTVREPTKGKGLSLVDVCRGSSS